MPHAQFPISCLHSSGLMLILETKFQNFRLEHNMASNNEQMTSKEEAISASAAGNDTSNDATIAQVMSAIQQLTDIFQFTVEQANEAVEAVGPDVTAAYNYILDQLGGEDMGGAIIPIHDCPHVEHVVKLSPENPSWRNFENKCQMLNVEKTETATGRLKGEYVDDECPSTENWLCLTCGLVACSRYVNGHSKIHYEDTKNSLKEESSKGEKIGHCIAASLTDLSVWCYECNGYLHHESLKPILNALEKKKFGE